MVEGSINTLVPTAWQRLTQGLTRRAGQVAAGAVLALAALLPAQAAPAEVSYLLGPQDQIRRLYPDASWLPPEQAAGYTSLSETIRHFTLQSLQRDGVRNAQVQVSLTEVQGQTQVQIRIRPVNATTRRYASVHPAWLDRQHAGAALRSVTACQQTEAPSRCWDPEPIAGKPWAFYLPLGLPMVNQRTVLFLDYPPLVALTGQKQDYLDNYTMCRWGRVLGAAGAAEPEQYETLLDSRPIAAPGTGVDGLLPDPIYWFDGGNDLVADSPYLSPMLSLLVAPASAKAGSTRPVAVFGTPARQAWARMIGRDRVDVLDTGTTRLPASANSTQRASLTTPWIATNHPDVTSYNCCPGDPSAKCSDRSGRVSDALISSEQTDFVAACWLQAMSATRPQQPEAALAACQQRWVNPPAPTDRQSLCIQAKLDNQNPQAACASYQEAWNYCSAHQANACATLDCNYDPKLVLQPLPAPAQRPAGWAETCQHYRYYSKTP
jgi:hypothetical protein